MRERSKDRVSLAGILRGVHEHELRADADRELDRGRGERLRLEVASGGGESGRERGEHVLGGAVREEQEGRHGALFGA